MKKTTPALSKLQLQREHIINLANSDINAIIGGGNANRTRVGCFISVRIKCPKA